MPDPRRPIELTLERTVTPAGSPTPITVRVSTTWDPAAASDASGALAEEMARLGEQLDAAVALVAPDAVRRRPDRTVPELVDAYHPRQPELVDLLRDEGELTPGEHAALRAHLEPTPAPPSFDEYMSLKRHFAAAAPA